MDMDKNDAGRDENELSALRARYIAAGNNGDGQCGVSGWRIDWKKMLAKRYAGQ